MSSIRSFIAKARPRHWLLAGLLVGLSILILRSIWTQPKGPVWYGNVDIREVNLSFRQSGRLIDTAFEEGDAVVEGAEVARLDPIPFEHRRDEAQAALAEAKAHWNHLSRGYRAQEIIQAQAGVKQAEAALLFATQEWTRQSAGVPTGATTRQSTDQARTSKEQATAQLASARADLSLKQEGYREEDIAAAKARVDQADARLSDAETALNDTRLLAPHDGIIQARIHEPGSMINAATPVYSLSLAKPVYVRAYVSEPDLAEAVPGRSVLVHCDSCPRPYRGQLGFVSPRAEFTPKSVETTDLRTDLVYRVRITIADPDGALRHGMPVTIQPIAPTR